MRFEDSKKSQEKRTLKTPLTPPARSRARDDPGGPSDLPVFLRGSEQKAPQGEHQNEASQRVAGIQKKSLEVSHPTDPNEKEADEVARKVVDGEAAQIRGAGGTISPGSERSADATPEFQSQLATNAGSGQSLDDSTRNEMESKMGGDFSEVRIHTSREAHNMNEAVNAKAFTHEQDIFFRQGEYNPDSKHGQELLAHELTHIAQQSGLSGASCEVIRRQAIDEDKDYDVVKFGERGEANLYRLSITYGVPFADVKRLNLHLEKDNWTVRKGDLISLPGGTLAKPKQAESMKHEAYNAVSSDSLPPKELPDTLINSGTIPTVTSQPTAPKQSTVHASTITGQSSKVPITQTPSKISATTRSTAHDLLHRHALYLPGSEHYVPFSLDGKGLGKTLAQGYFKHPTVVVAVLDLAQWTDRDDVASELIRSLWARQLLDPSIDTAMLQRLREEIDSSWVTSDEKKEQVHLLDLVLRIRGVSKHEAKDDQAKTKGDSKDSQLAEQYGLDLAQESEYQPGNAYIPFTGKKTGTKYEVGDVIAKEDRIAHYGSSTRPTWCNQFMMDLCTKILGKKIFEKAKSKSADGLLAFMNDSPETFEELVATDDSPFKKAWQAVNEGSLVFFAEPSHVATGVPTPIDKLSSRTLKNDPKVTYQFGDVIQAGASVGKMQLNAAWGLSSFPKLKAFKYIGG